MFSNALRNFKTGFQLFLFINIFWLTCVSCSPGNQEKALPVPPTPENNKIILLYYNERPPYLVTTNHGVEGLTGSPTTLIFDKSGIPFQWEQIPSKRQIYLLQKNNNRICLVGWFKTEERENYARYTLPVYQDKPQFALARADNNNISSGHTVAEVFSNRQLNLLVKDGYSYGSYLDNKIKEYDTNRTVTTNESSGMLEMVFFRHADYFFVAPEEAEGLMKTSKFDPQDFKTINFTDIPSGEKRYILCSMQVEESVVEQLNTAIRQYISLPSE
jgi:polar amino acid transport system substrate-binding protein